MSKHLDRGMTQLRTDLVDQFGVVEQMIGLSVRSLTERRPDFAKRVIETDSSVDATDIRIEEECLKLLALHQPVAEDLRWIITAVKVNGELERMADLACRISERSQALDLFPLFEVPDHLDDMVRSVLKMVRISLDSFIDQDDQLALEVIASDARVDELNVILIDELHQTMKSSSDQIEPAIHCFSASRHLERIADMACHVAEETVYLVSGEIVRHRLESGDTVTGG
ncbi:MAG: phosphate signaling complex protein PhoU [Planctomycetota bacterium]